MAEVRKEVEVSHDVDLNLIKKVKRQRRLIFILILISLILFYYICFEKYQERVRKIQLERGQGLITIGQYEKAIIEIKKAILLRPNDPFAHFLLAQSHLARNQLEDARREYEVVVSLGSANADTYFNLAFIYRIKDDEYKAMKYAKKAIKLKPNYTAAHLLLADVYVALKKWKEALLIYDNLVTYKPPGWNIAEFYIRKGLVHAESGDMESARQAWLEALKIDPKSKDASRLIKEYKGSK